MNGMTITMGYALATYMGLAFYYTENPSAQWRGPLGLGLIFPLIQLLIIIWAPESPRYLLMKGRVEEARKIVMDIHHVAGNSDQEYARGEFYQMQKQAEFDRALEPTYKAMFFKKSYRMRTILACGFAFIGQSTAVLVINNYGPTLYAALGYGTLDQLKLQCGWITMGKINSSTKISCPDKLFSRSCQFHRRLYYGQGRSKSSHAYGHLWLRGLSYR